MEGPVPFIETTLDGVLKVNEDLKQMLSQAETTISVIAVVGMFFMA
jgi:hypothetical protein